MLKSVDRILVVVKDLDQAEKNYSLVLGATKVEDYESSYLNAKVRRMAIGVSEVEFCQPLGQGRAQKRLDEKGEGLLYGGVSTPDLEKYAQHLSSNNINFAKEDGRLYHDGEAMYGLPLVISQEPDTPRQRNDGPVEFLYELTVVLKSPWNEVAEHYSKVLGIDRKNEVGITFSRFGYDGTLLRFTPDKLDRIELSEAHDTDYPMGRYTAKHGDAFYMCYVQTDNLEQIVDTLLENKMKWTRRTTNPVERDGLWLHPSVTNGVLMGVSRTSLAWQWSGKPELVQPLD